MDADRQTAIAQTILGPTPPPPQPQAPIPIADHGDRAVASDFTQVRAAAAAPDPWKALNSLTGEEAGPAAAIGAEAAAGAAKPGEEAPQPLGWRILNGAKKVAKDIAGGIGETITGKTIVGGLFDSVNQANDLIADATAGLPGPYFQVFNAHGEYEPKVMSHGEGRAQQLAEREQRGKGLANGLTYNMAKPETTTGEILRTIVSFLATRRAIAGNPTTLAGNVAADVGAGAMTLSPNATRLSNVIDDHYPNFVADFLKAKPEEEGTMLSHLKSGLEMGGLGQLFAGVVKGVKALKDAVAGTPGLAEKILNPAPAGAAPASESLAAGEGLPAAVADQAPGAAGKAVGADAKAAPVTAAPPEGASPAGAVPQATAVPPGSIPAVPPAPPAPIKVPGPYDAWGGPPDIVNVQPTESGAAKTTKDVAKDVKLQVRDSTLEHSLKVAAGGGEGEAGGEVHGAEAASAEEIAQKAAALAPKKAVGAAPDAAAKRFLELGDPQAPMVQSAGAPKWTPDLAGTKQGAEDYLRQEVGTKAVPFDVDGYVHGSSGNPVRVNLARIESPADVRDAIGRVASLIPEARPISHDETIWAADGTGLTPEDILAKAGTGDGLAGRLATLRAEMLAARMVRDSAADQLVTYAKAAANPASASPEAKALFARAFATNAALQQEVGAAQAEYGRGLDAFKILSRQSADKAAAIKQIVEGSGEGNLDTMASKIADLDNPLAVNRLLADSFKDTGRDNFMKFFYNTLLSNPRTVVKKLTSDSVMASWNIATRYAAEKFGSGAVVPGETSELAYGYVSSFKDGLRAAGEGLRKGESQFFQRYQSMDALHSGRIGSLADDAPEAFANDQPTRAWSDYLRSALPTSWIGAADDFAKTINYRAELRSLAYRAAAGSPDPDTAMAQMMDNVPLSMHKQAVAAALKNTFQEPLGRLGQLLQDTADAINLPVAHTQFEIPLGRILLPFVKVPLNIAKWSYNNSPLPLAFPSSQIRQELAAGGATRDLAIAKIGMGSSLSMALGYEAISGNITGRGPSDPQLQRAWRAAGNEPYSIKAGDKWYGYNMVEPMGLMAGAIADTVSIMKFAKEEDRGDLAASAVFGAGNAMLSKTYLQGVAEFFKTLEAPDDHSAGYADRLLASFVPFSSGLAGISQAMDQFKRAHYDLLDTIESRLPYISQGLPPQRTLWGDPIPVRAGFMPPISGSFTANLLSPISVKGTEDVQPIDKWIYENRMAFPRGPDNKTGLTKPGIVQDFSAGRGISAQVQLTPEQHDRLQVLAGNELKDPSSGLGAKDTLNGLVEGHGPEALQRQWDNAPPAAQALIVQSVVNKFRAGAKQQLLQEFPDIQEAVTAGWQARAGALSASPQ